MTRKRRIKLEGHALEDANVSHISLVSRPANRTPFRIMKSIDKGSEERPMFNFSIFGTQKQEKSPAIKAVIVNQAYAEAMATKLEADGFKIDDRTEQDGVVLFKQGDYDETKVAGVQLSEHVGILVSTAQKQFQPFPDSVSFNDNAKASGFMPGVSFATMALEDTVRTILSKAETRDDAVNTMQTALSEFSSFVMNLANDLPEEAFKIEKAAGSLTEADQAQPAEKAEPEAKADEDATKADDPQTPGDAGGDGDEAAIQEEAAKADADQPATKEDGPVTKSIEDVLKAVEGLSTQVAQIAEGQESLQKRADETEAAVKATQENLETTQKSLRGKAVTTASDDAPPEDTGQDGGARKEDKSVWDGVGALDRLTAM